MSAFLLVLPPPQTCWTKHSWCSQKSSLHSTSSGPEYMLGHRQIKHREHKVDKSCSATWVLENPWTSLAAVKGVLTGLVFVIKEPKMRQSGKWRNKFGHHVNLAERVWEKEATSELLQRQKAKGPASQLGSSCWGFHITQLCYRESSLFPKDKQRHKRVTRLF